MSFTEKKRTKRKLIDEFDFVKYHEISIRDNEHKTLDKYIHNNQYTFSIRIQSNTSISTVPDSFPNLYELHLYDTFVERVLCHSIRHLVVEKNYEIKYINDLLHLKSINIHRCINLLQINNKNVQSIDASNCNKLEAISHTIKLEKLKLYHCPKLKEIPSMSNLRHLYISHCDQLYYLTHFPNVTHLFIDSCKELIKVSSLMNIRSLKIINCPSLTMLSDINHIENAYINDCMQFTVLDNISSITSLHLISCALQSITKTSIHSIHIRNSLLHSVSISVPELHMITFEYCNRLTKIHVQTYDLRVFTIKECIEVTDITMKNKTQIDKLELNLIGDLEIKKINTNHLFKLTIQQNHKIRKLKDVQTIEELSITDCHHLHVIGNMENIVRLSIKNCPVLEVVTDITGIEFLYLHQCPKLMMMNCTFVILRILIIEQCPRLVQVFQQMKLHKASIKQSGLVLFDIDFSSTTFIETEDTTLFGTTQSLQDFIHCNQKAIQSISMIQRCIRSHIIRKFKNNASTLTVPTTCSICLTSFQHQTENIILTVCLHSFHTKCLERWFKESRTCPMCKNPHVL